MTPFTNSPIVLLLYRPLTNIWGSNPNLSNIIIFLCITLIQNYDVPVGVAAANGHLETVWRLLEAGANINHHNKVMIISILCAQVAIVHIELSNLSCREYI